MYKEIKSLLLINIKQIPKFNIEVNYSISEKEERLIDCLELQKGRLTNFLLTRNGRITILDENKVEGFESKKIEEAIVKKFLKMFLIIN